MGLYAEQGATEATEAITTIYLIFVLELYGLSEERICRNRVRKSRKSFVFQETINSESVGGEALLFVLKKFKYLLYSSVGSILVAFICGETQGANPLTLPMEFYCPPGTNYNTTYGMCENTTEVIGPFPDAMVKRCHMVKQDKKFCEGGLWDLVTAGLIRRVGRCPFGTFLNENGACFEGDQTGMYYGPFTKDQVRTCKKSLWGSKCDQMKWSEWMLIGKTNPKPSIESTPDYKPVPYVSGSKISASLFKYYSEKTNYNRVFGEVKEFYGTRSNGCVAFMTSALRQIGVPVPKSADRRGENISLVTRPFSNYLEHDLGWTRIRSEENLKPGDVVFTKEGRSRGYPAHTYMFAGWQDRKKGEGTWLTIKALCM